MNNLKNSLFFSNFEEGELSTEFEKKIEEFLSFDNKPRLYIIRAPLVEKKYLEEYKNKYKNKHIIILSPKSKIIILNISNDNNDDKNFENFYQDFLEDLGTISDNFNYKKYIGRPRDWKDDFIKKETFNDKISISQLLENNKLEKKLQRKNELLISLLVGSINDLSKIEVEEPTNLLEKIKNKITLFDGDQTNFIYKDIDKKVVFIQGLAGTGKTELLLHKLRELYTSSEDYKIFFTCHNKVLSNNLKERVPTFFDFMKVNKQIEWNKRLWVTNAWGSVNDTNSGLYRYVCDFYNIPFYTYSSINTFEKVLEEALNDIENSKNKDDFAFDFVLIDESQDFPEIFFSFCEKVTKNKVYVAGDIFQDIFENFSERKSFKEVDIALNKCYRTDPRTFMFAQAIGMGLFEDKKINWLDENGWKASGYKVKKNDREILLSRDSIRRFEDLENENVLSIKIEIVNESYTSKILEILERIISENPTIKPDDIAIVIFGKLDYDFMNNLEIKIVEKFNNKYKINKGFLTKTKIEDTIFVSNPNNIKGLEFPFVICVSTDISNDYIYRNSLYTMLTRSLIQSYLVIKTSSVVNLYVDGLKVINQERCIKTIEPTKEEIEEINKRRQNFIYKEKQESFSEFLTRIFTEMKIPRDKQKDLKNMIISSSKLNNSFDEENIKSFISRNINDV